MLIKIVTIEEIDKMQINVVFVIFIAGKSEGFIN